MHNDISMLVLPGHSTCSRISQQSTIAREKMTMPSSKKHCGRDGYAVIGHFQQASSITNLLHQDGHPHAPWQTTYKPFPPSSSPSPSSIASSALSHHIPNIYQRNYRQIADDFNHSSASFISSSLITSTNLDAFPHNESSLMDGDVTSTYLWDFEGQIPSTISLRGLMMPARPLRTGLVSDTGSSTGRHGSQA